MDRLLTVSLTAVEVCWSVERPGHGPTVDSVTEAVEVCWSVERPGHGPTVDSVTDGGRSVLK